MMLSNGERFGNYIGRIIVIGFLIGLGSLAKDYFGNKSNNDIKVNVKKVSYKADFNNEVDKNTPVIDSFEINSNDVESKADFKKDSTNLKLPSFSFN